MKPSALQAFVFAPSVGEDFPSTSVSHARRWLFRLAAMVVGPLLLLLCLEIGLRLAGVGHPMSFFLTDEKKSMGGIA